MAEQEKTQMMDEEATQAFQAPQSEATQLAVTVECPVCHTRNAAGDPYCDECGFLLGSEPGGFEVAPPDQVGAYLVDTVSGREFPIRPGENSIGRQDSDILLTDSSISRSHAAIHAEDGAYYLEDLGSTNGTFVNGAQIPRGERTVLASGDSIKFGTFSMEYGAPGAPEPPLVEPAMETEVGTDHPEELEIQEGEQVAAPEAAAPEAEEETAEVVVPDVTEGFEVESVVEPSFVEPVTVEPAIIGRLVAADGTAYEIREGVTTIGRAAGNDVVLPDPYVSSRHAQIIALESEVTITDVGSTNGTTVNGGRIAKDESVVLEAGSVVEFGKQSYTFERD